MDAGKQPTYGLNRKKQMPIFNMLRCEIFGEQSVPDLTASNVAEDTPLYRMKEDERISKLVALIQELYLEIERELKLTGFWESIPARNKLIAHLQKAILQPGFSAMPGSVNKRKHIISRLMEIAERNHDIILYVH